MAIKRNVEFEELVGEHWLSGVARYVDADYGYDGDDADVLLFVLDGKTYLAHENPEDGYRSDVGYFVELSGKAKKTMVPIKVRAEVYEGDDEGRFLNLIDVANNEIILSVGTETYDSYYPQFVAQFMPEKMAINQRLDA
jgi:hypothetical protein